MDTATLTKLAIAAGIVFAVYKFAPNNTVKAMALGVGGTIAAKQIPYVKDMLA